MRFALHAVLIMAFEITLTQENDAPDLESPYMMLVALKRADLSDAEGAEAFRSLACRVCQQTVGLPEDDRWQGCVARRCHLRDVDRLRAERQWLLSALSILDKPEYSHLHPDKVRELNRRIWDAGALLVGLTIPRERGFTLSLESAGLLARLHGAVVTYLAFDSSTTPQR